MTEERDSEKIEAALNSIIEELREDNEWLQKQLDAKCDFCKDDIRKKTAKEILIYLLDGLKKQRNRYSQEYDKWDSAQKDCDREDWKADYKEKREKANGYYLMADRAIGYIKALAKAYGVEVEE